MATSNFMYYNDLPNLYFKTIGELLDAAYYEGLDEDAEQKYIDKECSNYRVLDEIEYGELEDYIDEMNNIIKNKSYSYVSNRQASYEQADLLNGIAIALEDGHYEGMQISLKNYCYYKNLNKTNQKLIKSLFIKIAKKFHLYSYDLAYRYSNGETGFNLIKKY